MTTAPPVRRAWLLAALAAAILLEAAPGAAQAPPRRFVIDSHIHYADEPDFFDRLVSTYRPRNAMACVLTPMKHLAVLKAAAAAHPDVVIPYGQIGVDDPRVMAEVDAFAAAGAEGIKMHTPLHDWDDQRYFPIYAKLQERGLVALFHTGIVFGQSDLPEPSSMARMRPSFLHTIARSFPRLRIQGAHLGNPWYDEAAEVARWEKNLHFDLTGSSLIKKKDNLAVFKEYLWWPGPTAHSAADAVYAFEKLVFGTDEAPDQIDNMLGRYEAMLDACGVPESSRRRIYGETMARILGIPVRP
ncbi:MAG TPA: amidohydrolase family protein [Vicinamibacteria bacterium]|nr:amidohydrolase family protein [Vicinamibacteria bacterium]